MFVLRGAPSILAVPCLRVGGGFFVQQSPSKRGRKFRPSALRQPQVLRIDAGKAQWFEMGDLDQGGKMTKVADNLRQMASLLPGTVRHRMINSLDHFDCALGLLQMGWTRLHRR